MLRRVDPEQPLTPALYQRKAGDASGRAARSSIATVLVWLVVLVCSGLPLIWLAAQLFINRHVLVELRLDSFRIHLLGRTLLFNGLAALIAIAMAVPAGIVLGRGRGFPADALWFVLPVSLLLPSLAYAYGWKQFFRLIGHDFEPASWPDIARCVWTLATWLWPLPAGVIGLVLRRSDPQVPEQALLDGALWRVTFRQLLAPIAASFCVVGVLAVQEFAVYEPTGISVVATEVRMVFETGAFASPDNPITQIMGFGAGGGASLGNGSAQSVQNQAQRAGAAVATSIPLLLIIAALSLVAAVSARRLSTEEQVDVGTRSRALGAPHVFVLVAWLLVGVTVVLPMLSMALSLKVAPNPARIWDEFSPQIVGSLIVASVTGIMALAIAMLCTAGDAPGAAMVGGVTFLIGGQLLAIALLTLYNRPALRWAYNGLPIIVAAHLARFGWVALLAGRWTHSRAWRGLRDLAAVDGAGTVRTAASVVWPLAWPALGAAGVVVMVLALTEVPATVLISPQRPQVLIPMMMTWVHMLRYDAMIEASLLLCGTVVILGFCAVVLTRLALRIRGVDSLRSSVPRRVLVLLPLIGILIFNGCGDPKAPEAVWCDTGTGPAQVVYPRAIAYSDRDDTFVVVDRLARVQRLDRKGKCVAEWRMPEFKYGKPVGVSVAPDGNVYVADTHYHRVMVFSPDGKQLRTWGKQGTGPGEFIYPTDVAFDDKGRIFVGEYGDHDRIQVFDHDGKYLYEFGRFGQGDGEFSRPESLVIVGDTMYVTDACNHRIVVFKTDGKFVRSFGHSGSAPGEFRFPYGMDLDRDGNLIVVEFGNARVQKIDPKTGRCLAMWGSAGREPGQFAYPWAVTVDKRNRIVAVDSGNNRLQVFQF
jgi:ABC-type Fe3+ transport system permease subunit/sugar lactone lactonase YvrE